MEISFYNDIEFIGKNPNLSADGKKKGTYYVNILNELDNIIDILESNFKMEEMTSKMFLDYETENYNLIVKNFINLIEKNIVNETQKMSNKIEEYKNMIEIMKTDIEVTSKWKTEEKEQYINGLQDIINKLTDMVNNKEIKKNILQGDIYFLKSHKNKISFYILNKYNIKAKIKKELIKNYIETIYLPACRKNLCYEQENKIQYFINIYLEKKDLNFEEFYSNVTEMRRENKLQYINTYTINDIRELINLYFNELIMNRITLKECENCRKYFIANNKQIYCDNPSPQNHKKSCRFLANEIKSNSDKIYKIYRKTYKTQHNKLKRYIDTGNIPEEKLKERFKKWNEIAILKKAESKTADEYNKWYQTSLNWIEDFK